MKELIIDIVLLVATWIALRAEKKSIVDVFGFKPVAMRMGQFAIGFAATALLVTLINIVYSTRTGLVWEWNPAYRLPYFAARLYWTFRAVLLEELVFRGYLFYRLWSILGERKAVAISAAAYGAYHWFAFGVLGDPLAMVWIFLFMGLAGLMLAFAFTRSGSLLLPLGLHWGGNFMTQGVFTPHGDGMLAASNPGVSLGSIENFVITNLPWIIFSAATIFYLTRKFPQRG